jgi:hypothetical protein
MNLDLAVSAELKEENRLFSLYSVVFPHVLGRLRPVNLIIQQVRCGGGLRST